MTYIVLLIVILLLVVLIQDSLHRSIWWFLPPLIFVGGIVLQYPNFMVIDQLYSILFVGALMLFLFGYVYLRFKSLDVFKTYFGIGDLLLLIALVPFFEFRNYIFFFTAATLISLLIHGIVFLFKRQSSIPYAGYLSLSLVGHLVTLYLFHFSFFDLLDV